MTQEALKLALEALETELSIDWTNNDEFNASAEKMYEAIAAIKKALAQPEQEPYGIALRNIPHPQGVSAPDDLNADALEVVELELPDECEAVGWADDGVINWIADKQFKHASFLYPTPPQRTFVGLTEEERSQLVTLHHGWNEYGQAIEAKLKEKNNG